MNLELLNPFAQSFPEGFDSSIDAAALCARFNPRGVFAGHFIAVGRVDGAVAVLDFETKGIVRWLEGHVKAVTTLCWSHNSRYLLTASRDWNAIIWDLSSAAFDTPEGERKHTVRFDAPVTSADLHPRTSKILVVTLHAQVEPVFVDLREDVGGRWELLNTRDEVDPEDEDDDDGARKLREIATVCRFNPRGDLIYVGTSKGNINIWNVERKEFMWSENTGTNSTIKHLEFDDRGTAMVINSNDRCIRVISLPLTNPNLPTSPTSSSSPDPEDKTMNDIDNVDKIDDEAGNKETEAEEEEKEEEEERPPGVPYFDVQHKFQDLVNRTPWNGCAFSRDGEYIIGGAGHKASHNIYIWDRESGGLLKILEGPKDPLEDLDWHPIRPLIASVSSLGLVHIWTTGITENWSAYAPGFEELDENMEYQEKEDEFDIEDEQAIKRRKADEQDRPVDIMTVHQARAIEFTSVIEGDTYDEFIAHEPDHDESEAFYPEPELDPWYEEEPEVPPLFPPKVHDASAEDSGNVSEELGITPVPVVEEERGGGKKRSRKR